MIAVEYAASQEYTGFEKKKRKKDDFMPNIKKASALRNYTAVLDEVEKGSPVFLMREGERNYAIIDMDEYDAIKDGLWNRFFNELDSSRATAEKEGWLNLDEVGNRFMTNG